MGWLCWALKDLNSEGSSFGLKTPKIEVSNWVFLIPTSSGLWLLHVFFSFFGYWVQLPASGEQLNNLKRCSWGSLFGLGRDVCSWFCFLFCFLNLLQWSCCHLGHGDGKPRDEPHYLLSVWSWNCSAIPRHNFPERIPSNSACWQCAANGSGRKYPWKGK